MNNLNPLGSTYTVDSIFLGYNLCTENIIKIIYIILTVALHLSTDLNSFRILACFINIHIIFKARKNNDKYVLTVLKISTIIFFRLFSFNGIFDILRKREALIKKIEKDTADNIINLELYKYKESTTDAIIDSRKNERIS